MSRYLPIVLGVVAFIVIVSASFVVDETEQVVITQFGKPVGEAIVEPGIHFKIPIIQNANFFDRRFLEWDGDPNQIPTKDKRFIWVDTYGRWRITDPLLFFQRVRDERGAQSRLDDVLDGETRNAIANQDLVEIIRSTNRKALLERAVEITEGEDVDEGPRDIAPDLSGDSFLDAELPSINYGREKITREIIAKASPRLAELGIELMDVRLKRIDYVEEVRQKIFERMITERKRIADKFRSEGQGEASKILGDKERELKRIQSDAYRQAQEIMGEADAEATAIYARAYNQSAGSRDLYRFVKTMETYRSTFSEKDWLILSTKGDFFRYLQKQNGR